MNLTDLETFVLVAETGTISAAAQRLGVPKSTVSRRVRRLEDALGHELLRRSPRSVALTDHGRALHERSARSLQELRSAADALAGSDAEPSGTLRVTTVPGFGHSHPFLDCISEYGRRYPSVRVELELSTRLVNLVEEGFDVGVRLHIGPIPARSSLMSRRLLRFSRGIYASPTYLREMGAPSSVSEIANHRLAVHSIVDARDFRWRDDGRSIDAPVSLSGARWAINDSAALERIALFGAGLALLSTFEAEQFVRRGALVRVLPTLEQEGASASLVWPSSRFLAPRVRTFIDHAVETLGAAKAGASSPHKPPGDL